MAQLDPSIILAGQSPDIVGSMDAGAIAGQRARQFQSQNALSGYLQQNGADVMAGKQNALNGSSAWTSRTLPSKGSALTLRCSARRCRHLRGLTYRLGGRLLHQTYAANRLPCFPAPRPAFATAAGIDWR